MNALETSGQTVGISVFKRDLQKMLDDGKIARIGRNVYCIPENGKSVYSYRYSDLANEVATAIQEAHPMMKFSISELIQINEFVNHQIAHNIIFVSVENDVMEFVFDTLKEKYHGNILLNPTAELFHRYWCDNMIVIEKLPTEAPKNKDIEWHARIEKMLVDIMTEQLWTESISKGEIPIVFETAFERYIIDETCLFRYAQRRTADKRIKKLIAEQTNIKLITMR